MRAIYTNARSPKQREAVAISRTFLLLTCFAMKVRGMLLVQGLAQLARVIAILGYQSDIRPHKDALMWPNLCIRSLVVRFRDYELFYKIFLRKLLTTRIERLLYSDRFVFMRVVRKLHNVVLSPSPEHLIVIWSLIERQRS